MSIPAVDVHSNDSPELEVWQLKSLAFVGGRAVEMLVDLAGIPREHLDGKHHSCPGCGGKDRFRLIDGSAGAVLCSQCFNERNGDFIAAIMHYAGHSFAETKALCKRYLGLDDQTRTQRTRWHKPTLSHAGAELASPEQLDRVYRALLGKLELTASHEAALRERGLNDEQIGKLKAFGVRSLNGSHPPMVSDLIADVGETSLVGVPGFVVKTSKRGSDYWTLSAAPGMVFPIFDADGHIVALQVRKDVADDQGKYAFVSSKRYDGPSPGTPVQHCFGDDRTEALVTEGGLKAIIAHVKSGRSVLGMSGVNSHSRELVLGSIRSLNLDKAIVALDADWTTNVAVFEAVRELRNAINNSTDARFVLATWEDAKGLDDALLGKVKIIETADANLIDQAIEHAATTVVKDVSKTEGVLTLPVVARSWLDDGDKPPRLFPVGIDWECAPETLITIGGAPGDGKSTLVLQLVTDAALADRSLRVIVANVEMTGKHQFVRQLALVSGEPYADVRIKQADQERVAEAYKILRDDIGDRFAFIEWLFDIEKVAKVATDHKADIVVLDYVQRICADVNKPERDQRLELDRVMAAARRIAMDGRCVIAVSSLNRGSDGGRGKGGEIAQHRFRGSAELEFACNEGWIISRDDSAVTLHSVKQRDRQNFEINLVQDSSLRFTPVDVSGITRWNDFDDFNRSDRNVAGGCTV